MKPIIPGHVYELDNLKNESTTQFQFYMDSLIHGKHLDGPSCQEVTRMLIDRVNYLDGEKSWFGNGQIIQHLRCVIALFEARALLRKVDEDKLAIEDIQLDKDGHIKLT